MQCGTKLKKKFGLAWTWYSIDCRIARQTTCWTYKPCLAKKWKSLRAFALRMAPTIWLRSQGEKRQMSQIYSENDFRQPKIFGTILLYVAFIIVNKIVASFGILYFSVKQADQVEAKGEIWFREFAYGGNLNSWHVYAIAMLISIFAVVTLYKILRYQYFIGFVALCGGEGLAKSVKAFFGVMLCFAIYVFAVEEIFQSDTWYSQMAPLILKGFMFYLVNILIVPVVEEIVYRGILYKGMARSQLGSWVAICVQAILWTSAHSQYELFGVDWCFIFVMGVALGLARWYTSSLVPCVAAHMLQNAIVISIN